MTRRYGSNEGAYQRATENGQWKNLVADLCGKAGYQGWEPAIAANSDTSGRDDHDDSPEELRRALIENIDVLRLLHAAGDGVIDQVLIDDMTGEGFCGDAAVGTILSMFEVNLPRLSARLNGESGDSRKGFRIDDFIKMLETNDPLDRALLKQLFDSL